MTVSNRQRGWKCLKTRQERKLSWERGIQVHIFLVREDVASMSRTPEERSVLIYLCHCAPVR